MKLLLCCISYNPLDSLIFFKILKQLRKTDKENYSLKAVFFGIAS